MSETQRTKTNNCPVKFSGISNNNILRYVTLIKCLLSVGISAAHCVTENFDTAEYIEERQMKVFLGKHYKQLDENDENVQSKEVNNIVTVIA